MSEIDNKAPVEGEEVITDEQIDESQESWDDVFDEQYGADGKTDDDSADDDDKDDATDDDKPDDDDKSDDDKKSEEEDDEKKSDKETVVGKTDDEKKEEDPSKEQRQVVKDAIGEVFQEQQANQQTTIALATEAFGLIFPEGVEDPRVDSDGDPITSAKQVESLYNPKTGENFTPEEAKEWFDNATNAYNQNLNSARQEAIRVTEVAMRMEKGREAVQRVYGDFIKDNPEIAQKVLQRYLETVTIKGEGNNSYVSDAPVDVLEFYNDVMYPYVELAEKQADAKAAAEAEAKAKEEAIKKGKAQREESRDFKTNVSEDAGKSSDESDWDSAFNDYYGTRKR